MLRHTTSALIIKSKLSKAKLYSSVQRKMTIILFIYIGGNIFLKVLNKVKFKYIF